MDILPDSPAGLHPHHPDPVERRISDRAFVGPAVWSVLGGLLLAALCFASPFPFLAPVGLLPPAAVWAWAQLARMGACYRLHPERLEVERGIISRSIENVELFRIRDVGLRQGPLGRLLDFGDVYVHSTDASAPDVRLQGIDAPREFYELLRSRVAQSRAQGRTVIVEGATPRS